MICILITLEWWNRFLRLGVILYSFMYLFSSNNKTRWHFFMVTDTWFLCHTGQSGCIRKPNPEYTFAAQASRLFPRTRNIWLIFVFPISVTLFHIRRVRAACRLWVAFATSSILVFHLCFSLVIEALRTTIILHWKWMEIRCQSNIQSCLLRGTEVSN